MVYKSISVHKQINPPGLPNDNRCIRELWTHARIHNLLWNLVEDEVIENKKRAVYNQ